MRKGTRQALFIILGVVVVGALIAANLKPKKSQKGAEVKTEEIGTRRIEAWVRAPGKIQPVTQVQVSSNVIGRVAELAVQEGQRVAKGDLLLRLDDERYRSLVQQVRAQIESGQANVGLAEAELREVRQNFDRSEAMYEQGLVSEADRTAMRTRAEVAEARLDAAKEEIRRAQAALVEAEKNLRETVFVAALDGTITQLNVEVGENVLTGTMNNPGTVILTLADLSAMEVLADVDETDVVQVAPGQSCRVLVDALPDTSVAGTVTRVGSSGRGTTGAAQEATNFEVAVLLQDPPPSLRPGMNADVEILTGQSDSSLVVPLQALTARPQSVVDRWKKKRAGDGPAGEVSDTTGPESRNLVEGIFLFDDGKARFVPVTMLLRGETHVEVRGQINVGDPLIVGPYKTLRKLADQDPVRLEKKKKKERKEESADASAGD